MRRSCFSMMLTAVLFFSSWCIPVPLSAGMLYSAKELLASGQQWIETSIQWNMELQAHDRRMKKINDSAMPETKKDLLRKRELARHMDRSHTLAAKRDQVQNVLVEEANARVKRGKADVSKELKDSLGTQFGQDGHRGMKGDKDMGGGSRTSQKVKEVLADMGLYNPDPALQKKNPFGVKVVETPGTLEIQGDFELTINKDGLKPKVGSEFHQVKVDVDAANPETYVSESLKTRNAKGEVTSKRVGADYVEIQDHMKKATKGLKATPESLAKNPKKMQGLAKGTVKTLDMEVLDNETLGRVLQQNGIKDTPDQFKKKLLDIKEGKLKISNADDALKLKNVSRDVFNASEAKVFTQTKKNIVDLRAEAAKLSTSDPRYQTIQDEIVDSVTKMKSTRAVNNNSIYGDTVDTVSSTKKSSRLTPDIESSGSRRKITPQTVDVELKRIGVKSKLTSVKEAGGKAFGAAMNILDIAQTCMAIEDYVEGKKPLSEVAVTIVDQYVTQGAISGTQQIYQKGDDYLAARNKIADANRNNMTAYLNAWEIQFRKAGMSKEEARKYVGNAMLAGNLEVLEGKGRELQAKGAPIKPPVLVADSLEADDTLAERAEVIATGIKDGAVESVYYLATTHTRVADALGEREIKEADLAANAETLTSETKVAMFKKLFTPDSPDIPARDVLSALDEWEKGNSDPLQALFKKKKAIEEAKKPTAEELAAMKAEEERLAAEAKARSLLLRKYSRYVNYLRITPLSLTVSPDPIVLGKGGEPVPLTFSLQDERKQYFKVAKALEAVIESLTGTPGKVDISYNYDLPGQVGSSPEIWLAESPTLEGVHSVTASIVIKVSGASTLPEGMELLKTGIYKQESLMLTVEGPGVDYSQGLWPELRKTNEVLVELGSGITMYGKVGAAANVNFQVEEVNRDHIFKTDVSITMASDGKSIRELIINTDGLSGGQLYSKDQYIFHDIPLNSLTKESESTLTWATYRPKRDEPYLGIYKQAGLRGSGEMVWHTEVTAGDSRSNEKVGTHIIGPVVSFSLDVESREKKMEVKNKALNKKKAQQDEIIEKSKTGTEYLGDWGVEEGLDGSIGISVSKDQKVVSGSFSGERLTGNNKKTYITGDFIGAMDPDTGEMEATLTKSTIMSMVEKDGEWYSGTDIKQMSKDTKIKGKLSGKEMKGFFLLKGKEGFHWNAELF